jgi:phosphoribosyl 1,2-cyclic phosphodiesterase
VRVMALASGSSGNSYLVQAGATTVLVDAGVAQRTIRGALAHLSLSPDSLVCLLLTHEHSDHVANAGALAKRLHLPIFGTTGTLAALPLLGGECQAVHAGAKLHIGELAVTPFSVPHDGREPVGYCLEHGDVRVCLATDLGHVPPEVEPTIRASDLVILESNHDVARLWRGPYPFALKQRVASPTGHLSNDQAAECLLRCAGERPRSAWLAHLSDTNNSPRLALRTVSERLQSEGVTNLHLEVALRDRPSLCWDSALRDHQPRLF